MSYLSLLKGLLPPGRWNLQGDSTVSKTLQAIADELDRVDQRARQLIEESDPRTAEETLDDWERVLGLPNEQIPEIPGTTAARRVAITQAVVAQGGQNRAYYEAVCAACGYPLLVLTRMTTRMMRCETARVGDRVYGTAYAFVIVLEVDAPTPGALTTDQFEAVIRKICHSEFTPLFQY